jgi:hypothetical protein
MASIILPFGSIPRTKRTHHVYTQTEKKKMTSAKDSEKRMERGDPDSENGTRHAQDGKVTGARAQAARCREQKAPARRALPSDKKKMQRATLPPRRNRAAEATRRSGPRLRRRTYRQVVERTACVTGARSGTGSTLCVRALSPGAPDGVTA